MAVKLTEVTHLPLPETKQGTIMVTKAAQLINKNLYRFDVLLSGCGIGQDEATSHFIRSLLLGTNPALPVVLDADALNILAKITNWWQQLTDDAILTPHPGEMARLAGMSVDEIQLKRIDIARAMAAKWRKIVVLKGAHTVVTSPDGRCQVSPFCNPGLATGGTGDVLSGVISGLLAQKVPLFEAATLGVYLHGKAGEIIKNRFGDTGTIASDLLPVLPLVIKSVKAQNVIND
jgi:NAD(P)H-hydrate epimerase